MRVRVTVSTVSVAVLLATITACGSVAAQLGSTAATPAAPATPAPSEPPGGSKVKLLDPGAEPRDTLRFAMAAGSQTVTTMNARTGVKLTIDGRPGPSVPVIPLAADVTTKINTVAPNGDADGTYTMDHFRLDGPVGSAAAQKGVQQLDGLTGTFTVNARGEALRSEIQAPPGLDPKLAGTLDSLSSQLTTLTVPFPADPVGIGARWTGSVEAKVNGIATTVDYVYTLKQRTGSDYTIDATYQQGGEPQKGVALPGLPPGASADVDKIDITGAGTSQGSLTQLLPGTSSVKSSGTMGLTLHSGTRSSVLSEAVNISLELRKAA